MAFPTAINDQITDAVTQANVKVLTGAPAMARNLYQASAQALANAAHNVNEAQQQHYAAMEAAQAAANTAMQTSLEQAQSAVQAAMAAADAAIKTAMQAAETALQSSTGVTPD